tara:strand:- start:759 stop:1199 length:441 start_codon:yes stop_codon:yes gene_type:complete
MNNAIQIEIKPTQNKRGNMRKIEKNMMTAIRKNKNFTSGNTSTHYFNSSRKTLIGGSTQIRLHGHLIAIITDIKTDSWQRNDIELNTTFGTVTKPITYRTNTTKSRLNALLAYTPWKIVQKNSQWFVHSSMTNQMMPFHDGIKLPY